MAGCRSEGFVGAPGIEDRKRARESGVVAGVLPTGTRNAITDVAGVRVGHSTIVRGSGALMPGEGPVRTGVTLVLPHPGNLYRKKIRAAVHTINGYGKACGFEQVRELGLLESPIALTNTFNVGLVADALIRRSMELDPAIGAAEGCGSMNVVVGETNDGYLNDLPGRPVRYEHVRAAWDAALESGDLAPVAEGCVGAGTGTSCFGWKGGIGTASRVTSASSGGYTVGALVQSNFGAPENLIVCGTPVGRSLKPPAPAPVVDKGSIMIVLATDAPLTDRQLGRLARRASVGLARTGSFYGHGSGDFVVAFTTANPVDHAPRALTALISEVVDEEAVMAGLFPAVAEAVEEAVLNSLFKAETTEGRDRHIRYALPVEEVLNLIAGR